MVPPDLRNLNYDNFINKGEKDISTQEDYNSHNTHQLNKDELIEKLLKLDIINSALSGRLVEEDF